MSAWNDPAVAEKMLRNYRTWAVVGCSDDPHRASHGVARFLDEIGFKVLCVNPNHDSCIQGLPCYPDLRSIEEPIDVVDIFRRSEAVLPHVQEAVEVGAKGVWMQLGVVNHEAARLADEAGLDVVMDRCPKIEFRPAFLQKEA
ncbi:MAG: CoA-binding protein [Actinomycetota bacterium]|nr:CoA-binding protein [Actinomycetota bacterium]